MLLILDPLYIVIPASIFESLCVSESVQSMVARRATRTNTGKHDDLDFVAGHE